MKGVISLIKVRETPELISAAKDAFKDSCTIKLNGLEIPLELIAGQKRIFTLLNGVTCKVSYINGSLQIHSEDEVNVMVFGDLSASAIGIDTQGKAHLEIARPSRRRMRVNINANDIVLNSKLDCAGFINLSTNSTTDGKISILKPINVDKVVCHGGKVVMTKPLSVVSLNVKANTFRQMKGADIALRQQPSEFAQDKLQIEATNIKLEGQITGKNLVISALNRLSIYGNICVDNLKLQARYIYGGIRSAVDGVNNLFVSADYILTLGSMSAVDHNIEAKGVLNIGGEYRGKERLSINAFVTCIALGAQLRGTNVMILSAVYANLLGVARAFNFIVDCLASVDLGLTIPEIPHRLSSITNTMKVMVALRLIATHVYKPIGTIINLLFRSYRIFTKSRKLYERYKNHPQDNERSAKLNILNAALTVRDIFFAGNGIYEDRDFVNQCANTCTGADPEHTVNPFSQPLPSWSEVRNAVAKNALPAILPAYVSDSLHNFDRGFVCTGAKVVTTKVHDDQSTKKTLSL